MHALSTRCALVAAAAVIEIIVLGAPSASAVSREVRNACRQEYFDYCNTYQVGSPQLRQCMRRNQRRLSDGCVNALITSGEVTPGERARAKIARNQNRRSNSADDRKRRD